MIIIQQVSLIYCLFLIVFVFSILCHSHQDCQTSGTAVSYLQVLKLCIVEIDRILFFFCAKIHILCNGKFPDWVFNMINYRK